MSEKQLTLYVWPRFAPDYKDGIAFALAETLDEAKQMVKSENDWSTDWGEVSEYSVHQKIVFTRTGGQ